MELGLRVKRAQLRQQQPEASEAEIERCFASGLFSDGRARRVLARLVAELERS